jgi:hypothetical protein
METESVKKRWLILCVIIGVHPLLGCFAQVVYHHPLSPPSSKQARTIAPLNHPVTARVKKEEEGIPPRSFAITFYKPTYLLPY